MKILFLDIDGVVNNIKTTQRHGPYVGIDPVLVAKVKRIIKETKCKVVLSSTWRLDSSSREAVRDQVCDFIDVTPDLQLPYSVDGFRGKEVEAWLEGRPGITRYAILDDNNWFLKDQPLFKTSPITGITDEVADEVIRYLLT